MTVEQYGSNAPALGGDEDFLEGLDDFKPEDMGAPPRLNIEHNDKTFKVSSSGEEFETARLIILGMVRQRTLWHPDIPEGESPPPMCKSPDFEHGFPELSEDTKAEYRFPWRASGMSQDLLVDNGPDVKPNLSCSDCKLKEWGTDPKANRPWCTEEFTLPVLYESNDGEWQPALLTFKRSSLKAVKTYLASFKSSRTPLFAVVTTITLTQNKRGNVRYCTPNFSKAEATDRTMWQEYFDSFKGVRDYLKAFPQVRTDENNDSDGGGLAGAEDTVDPWSTDEPPTKAAPKKSPPAAPKAQPKASTATQAPPAEVIDVEVDDDDDEPPF